MKEQLIKLITVKTIITVVCLGLFVYAIVNGIVDGDFFKTVFTMVISFYFGTQVQKNTASYNEAVEAVDDSTAVAEIEDEDSEDNSNEAE